MKSDIKTKHLKIDGMTCLGCQNKIEKKLRNTSGVNTVKVHYSKEGADITYDAGVVSLKDITSIIKELGYDIPNGNEGRESDIVRVSGILLAVVSLYVLLQQFNILNMLAPDQLADVGMGYGMLFVIGLVTSVHCIAMCGGINLSQCIPHKDIPSGEGQGAMSTFLPAFLYNFGRVISYTGIGFILGFAGLLFGGGGSETGLPLIMQGILKLIAGTFMVIMGINMLGIFQGLRKFLPRIPKSIALKINMGKIRSRSPLIVGMLNGLMPCGPLQSMQFVALASGNPLVGALSMFLFSLGTVPLMMGLGSIVSSLGKKFTKKVMSVGSVLVVVLGLAMISQGGSLWGVLTPDLLLSVIIALCAVGIVSCIPFSKPFYKALSTIAALGVAAVLIVTLNTWDVGGNAPQSDDIKTDSSIKTEDSNIKTEDGDIKTEDGGAETEDNIQIINSTLSPRKYPNITVQNGTPVKWIIDAPKGSINGCNNRINIQEYGIEDYSFKIGENVIEFTPTKAGKFQYSCWMGMIHGSITVTETDALPTGDTDDDSA